MMKRTLSLFLAILIVFALSACNNTAEGRKSKKENSPDISSTQAPETNILCGSWERTGDTTEVLSFNSDGTGSVVVNGEMIPIVHWYTKGDSLIIGIDDGNEEPDYDEFDYTVTETTLTLDDIIYIRK